MYGSGRIFSLTFETIVVSYANTRTGDQRLSEAMADERPANVSFALPCKGAVICGTIVKPLDHRPDIHRKPLTYIKRLL